MRLTVRRILFLLFFLSGFCGLVYQVVWTRLAFAAFGIITPVLSIVISVFMLGLSLGSWGGGKFIGPLVRRTGWSAMIFYGIAEFIIGLGAFLVPILFGVGERLLLSAGQGNSAVYLTLSALVLAFSILPWCLFMGTTFPLVMAYLKEEGDAQSGSFSFLYLANVLGAMCGTFLAAVVLIELLGFRRTLWVAAAANFLIATISIVLGCQSRGPSERQARPRPADGTVGAAISVGRNRLIKWILFSTGFGAMAMEVVWTRLFTPVLKPQVYSFALVVFTYLGATFVGSWLYRAHLRKASVWSTERLMSLLMISVFLPLLAVDPRLVRMDWARPIDGPSALVVLVSMCPFCAVLGYLTPGLVDEYSGGQPRLAGSGYALNVLGCILGPLFACYVLLPNLSEKACLFILAVPFFIFYAGGIGRLPALERTVSGLAAVAVTACCLFLSRNFESMVASASTRMEERRDYAASVIAANPPENKVLLVNGMGMTYLTPITKFMVHLPMVFHKDPPQSALVICFGMGTSYRSALSWDVETTAVELVPGVTKSFGFYHADAQKYVEHPKGKIVIDDGRRFLRRTESKYDLIVVDPPPPVSAAGSSLLFSTEFCALARDHLRTNGILQMWFPDGEPSGTNAVTGDIIHEIAWSARRKAVAGQALVRSVKESFPYVRAFSSVHHWGLHVLASSQPIETPTVDQVLARMPVAARQDLMEWNQQGDLKEYIGNVIGQEIPIDTLLNSDPKIEITDDNPMNEYFILRQTQIINDRSLRQLSLKQP